MAEQNGAYAARLQIDYPDRLDRFTTFFRLLFVIPIAIILTLVSASGDTHAVTETGERVRVSAGGVLSGIAMATALMIVFRQHYPRWWFDFARELTRFGARVGTYLALLTDRYPSTIDEQSVHLELDYPDVSRLNRWLPLVKWFLVIPHIIVLCFLDIAAYVCVIIAWFAILFTGKYPRTLFDFVVGVMRWQARVVWYAALFATDKYPPFSIEA
jgi:hypothetical protein